MSEHAAAHEHHHGHVDDADHGGVGKYLLVFLALCVLTSASFFTYSHYWPFGKHAAWAFMMAVSCTKAMLVVMFFMHLRFDNRVLRRLFLTGIVVALSVYIIVMLTFGLFVS